MDVAGLLAQSRAAHQRYRSLSARINKHGTVTQQAQYAAAGAAIREALIARTDAQALDPTMADLAWADDRSLTRASSDHLIEFYVRYLAPEAHPVSA